MICKTLFIFTSLLGEECGRTFPLYPREIPYPSLPSGSTPPPSYYFLHVSLPTPRLYTYTVVWKKFVVENIHMKIIHCKKFLSLLTSGKIFLW